MNKINHLRIFTHALRTALLFVAGFLVYEILIELEKKWNLINSRNKHINFLHTKILKLISLFIIDLLILYFIAICFNVHH